jgi:PAS domain S-box-containing protein
MWLIIRSKLHRGAEREKAARSLHEIQERMDLAAEAARLGLWVWDVSTNTVWATEKLREILGFLPGENLSYAAILARVYEADRGNVDSAVQRSLRERVRFDIECRVLVPDGTTRWIAATGRANFTADDLPSQLLGVAIDITERHRVEEESRQVSSKLITAQEDERKRIARDLHDDLNQRLALLSVQMEIFGSDSSDTRGSARERLESMTAQVKGLSSEVHRLSYQLHPAKLDQLGLVVAARTFCREVSHQSGIAVHFEQQDVPRDLNGDVALCLYRVIQEALQNSVRHNGGAPIRVSLSLAGDELHLVIADDGKGFDVDHARHNGGLGLVSMRERVRQVNGSILFTSSPGKGTRIEVNVPLLRQGQAL